MPNYRTIADGDGSPMRVPVEPDPDVALEALLDEMEREQEDYDRKIGEQA